MQYQNDPLLFFVENFNGIVLYKNENSVYKAVNPLTSKLFGYKHTEDLTGTTDFDLKCEAVQYAETFRAQDKEALQFSFMKTIEILKFSDNMLRMLFVTRNTVKSPDGTVNLLTICNEVPPFIFNAFYKNHFVSGEMGCYQLIDEITNDRCHLSKRETQCVFLLLRGKTAKETAKLLNLSYKTVEEHLENIKAKLNCSKKSELIEKALSLGLDYYLPNSFVSNISAKA